VPAIARPVLRAPGVMHTVAEELQAPETRRESHALLVPRLLADAATALRRRASQTGCPTPYRGQRWARAAAEAPQAVPPPPGDPNTRDAPPKAAASLAAAVAEAPSTAPHATAMLMAAASSGGKLLRKARVQGRPVGSSKMRRQLSRRP